MRIYECRWYRLIFEECLQFMPGVCAHDDRGSGDSDLRLDYFQFQTVTTVFNVHGLASPSRAAPAERCKAKLLTVASQ